MQLLKAIPQRGPVHEFSEVGVSDAVVLDLLHAAAQTPTSLDQQPWAFAILHGRGRLADCSRRAKEHLLATSDRLFGLGSRGDQFADVTASLFHGANTLVLVCAKSDRSAPAEDCSLVVQTLQVAAHGRGLHSRPIELARSWFNQPHVKAELHIPPHYQVVRPIALGHPAQPQPAALKHEPEIACWHWDD